MTCEPHPLEAVLTAPHAPAVLTAPEPQALDVVLTSALLPHAPADFESPAPDIVVAIDIATATASIKPAVTPNTLLWP